MPEERGSKRCSRRLPVRNMSGCSYTPVYRLVKQLLRFAAEDVETNKSFKEARDMLQVGS